MPGCAGHICPRLRVKLGNAFSHKLLNGLTMLLSCMGFTAAIVSLLLFL